jgi:hypothetical protein
MSPTFDIDRESRVVLLTCGNTSLKQWRSTTMAIFADPRYQPGFAVLIDCRSATLTPSADDVRSVIDFIVSHRAMVGEAKWAVVVERIAGFGMARMAEALAQIAGINLRAFLTLEGGLGWVITGAVPAEARLEAQAGLARR